MAKEGFSGIALGSAAMQVALTPGASVVICHFTSRSVALGRFNRYPLLAGTSNVYLNPGVADWYLNGLPGHDGLSGTLRDLQSVIALSGASKVVFIGSSMGAWGACYFGSMLKPDLTILFGPELRLKGLGSYSSQNLADWTSPVPTPVHLPEARYVAIAGMASPFDVYSCTRFFQGDERLEQCHFLEMSGHATANAFKELGLLSRMLEQEIFGTQQPSIAKAISYPDNAAIQHFFSNREYDVNTICDYVDAFKPREHRLVERFLRSVAADLVSKKLPGPVISLLWKHYEAGTLSNDTKQILMQAARKAKRFKDAVMLADELAGDPKHKVQAYWIKSLSLEKMGKHAESVAAMRLARDAHLEDPIYKTASERLAALEQP